MLMNKLAVLLGVLRCMVLCGAQEAADAELTIMELFTKYGYHPEVHEVETEDGYLLTVHRMYKNDSLNHALTPVLLMHGLMGSSENFVIAGPKKSLSYLLANKGYDIWIPNSRGNTHSRKHKTLDPDKDRDFWMFSWHEIGKYDLPAVVDYMLDTTNHSQVIYIGHSQGTTVFYVMASERPEYQPKVKLSMSLAPSVFLEHTKHPLLRAISPMYMYWDKLVRALNQNEFLPFISNQVIRHLGKFLCTRPGDIKEICSNIIFMLIGYEPEQLDKATIPLIAATVPAGSSAMQALHYAQEITTGEFKQYDFGPKRNLKRYNATKPPMYNLNITTPIGLFYAENDVLNDVVDVEHLASILPNVVKLYKVPYKKFSHFDFVMAKDVVTLVYNEVFKLMDTLEISDIQNNLIK